MKRVRIKDIAEKAQVSTGTVDRVIHNRGKVSEEARERVLKVMQELQYTPNILAQTLARKKKLKICVFLPSPKLDFYWYSVYNGIQSSLKDLDHYNLETTPFFYQVESYEDFINVRDNIVKDDFDGLILASIYKKEVEELAQHFYSQNKAVILLNNNLSDFPKLSFIGTNPYNSGRLIGRLIGFTGEEKKITVLHLGTEISRADHLLEKERGLSEYFKDQNIPADIYSLQLNPVLARKEMEQKARNFISETESRFIIITTSRAYMVMPYLRSIFPAIKSIGFDLIPPNIDMIENGDLDVVINQNPFRQGYSSIQSIINHLVLNKPLEEIQYVPLDIVVKENLHYYNKQDIIGEYNPNV